MAGATPEWERVKAIVGSALDAAPEERRRVAEEMCGADMALRGEVFSLLDASESSAAVLNAEADAWLGALAEPSAALPERGLPVGGRIGGFEIEALVASRPGSAVYKARQRDPERTVALKVLRFDRLLGASPRFWLEASAAARVEHPNVVRVYEAGVVEIGTGERAAFLSMEFVEGVPITRAVRAGQLGVWEIVGLIEQVAAGVARIHQCGVIHRDLKPSNVLVDGEGRARVLDFGVARLVGGGAGSGSGVGVTLEGVLLGTPGYMSPEQIIDPARVDVRSDVWSLGAIAYELFAGWAPFCGGGVAALEVMVRTTKEEPVSVGSLAGAAGRRPPRDLAAVIMKALARNPGARYASVAEFAEDLGRAKRGLPVRARRGTFGYRVSRFARRHAAVIGIIGVAVVIAAVFGGLQVRAWRDSAHQRDRAAAVLGVLRGLTAGANPSFGERDVRMRDVLAGIERDLDRGVVSDRSTEAEVRALLGGMYFGLGEYERSRGLLQRAVDLRSEAGERLMRRDIEDRAALAQSLRWLYRPDEAEAIASEAAGSARARFGERDPATIAARRALAGCWEDLGRVADAVEAYGALVADAAAVHGEGARETLGVRGDRASALITLGRYVEAEAELRALVVLWAGHPGTLEQITARSNLAMVLAERGELDEAVGSLEVAEAGAVSALGAMHPTTVAVRTNLTEFMRRQGREAEAFLRGEDLVGDLAAGLGWAHEQTLEAVTGHAAALVRAGRGEEAAALVMRAVAESEAGLAPGSPWRGRLKGSLAAALSAAGRHGESAAAYGEAIVEVETALGTDHRQTLVARNNFGVACIAAGRAGEAVAELRAVLALVEERGYEEMRGVAMRNLGRAMLAAGDMGGGRAALEEAYRLSIARQEGENAALCARLLAEHFEASSELELAGEWWGRAGAGE